MNISYNWLKELIDIDLSPVDAAKELTRIGNAVEGIHVFGDDHIFDIDLTSNRSDCLSHFGIARELSAVTDASFRELETASSDTAPRTSLKLVVIEDPDLCHRFTARVISGVKVGRSPEWLVARLEAMGERSINNIADITNYVMLEYGQPMHAFDLDKLSEKRIVVRRSRNGEQITTLDEVERKLDSEILVICDAEKPAAIGGIMGGLASSITDQTINVLLEVAYFDRVNIRTSSRKLNLATEASYRFERGVDINNLQRASDRAASLILELAGGELGEFTDIYPSPKTLKELEAPDISASVKRLTGLSVQPTDCDRILGKLGIVRKPETNIYSLPSWRHDISIEEDLIEEVARCAGYENIGEELPPAFGAGEYQPTELRERRLRQQLATLGFDEAISYSFIDSANDDEFETVPGLVDSDSVERFVTLQDAVIDGAVRMRQTVLPGLLDAVRLNLNHQRRDVRLFEIGKVFATGNSENGLPNEQKVFGLAITGGDVEAGKATPVRPLDLLDAKGAVEAAFDAVGVQDATFEAVEIKHLRRGQSATILKDGFQLGTFGQLNEALSATYKFKQPVFVAEINLLTLLSDDATPSKYKPLGKYPGVVRDVSFLVKRDRSYSEIVDTVNALGHDLCRGVTYVDLYQGKGLADDERSLTVRFEYRSDERTLIEEEVESLHKDIVSQIEEKLGILQRF